MSETIHGAPAAYLAGCRCPLCTAGWARVQASRNASRRERLAADPGCVQHGLSSTYCNWGCRCTPCTTAHTIARNRTKPGRKVSLNG